MEPKALEYRFDGMAHVRVIQVIETVSRVGSGTREDPVRFITQYWDFEGNRLAYNDPLERKHASISLDDALI